MTNPGRPAVRGLPWLFGAEPKVRLLKALVIDPPSGGWTVGDLAREVGIDRKTARAHLDRLKAIGLVAQSKRRWSTVPTHRAHGPLDALLRLM